MMLVKSKSLELQVATLFGAQAQGILTRNDTPPTTDNYQVFSSNQLGFTYHHHWLHPGYIPVQRRFYLPDLFGTFRTISMSAASSWSYDQITDNIYKADQLPGWRYWEPTGEVQEIVGLKPHNGLLSLLLWIFHFWDCKICNQVTSIEWLFC